VGEGGEPVCEELAFGSSMWVGKKVIAWNSSNVCVCACDQGLHVHTIVQREGLIADCARYPLPRAGVLIGCAVHTTVQREKLIADCAHYQLQRAGVLIGCAYDSLQREGVVAGCLRNFSIHDRGREC